jgi:hypothetical protein
LWWARVTRKTDYRRSGGPEKARRAAPAAGNVAAFARRCLRLIALVPDFAGAPLRAAAIHSIEMTRILPLRRITACAV